MRISSRALPHLRLGFLIVFFGVCAVLFGYLWLNSGGRLPIISKEGYRVSIDMPRVSNLVYDSDVMIAGVPVGKVVSLSQDGPNAHAVMQLNSNFPIHQGATVEVRNKTLIEESYLDITDGHGAELPSGTQLPTSAGKGAVEVDDVLRSLDKPTRDALGSTIREAGTATQGSGQNLSHALQGLGEVGRQGSVTTAALAKQSADLTTLSGKTATLLTALDERQGQIAQLVDDSRQVFDATAKNQQNLAATVQTLPGLLDSVHGASGSLTKLSGSLAPVAAGLNAAAPDLSHALEQLPDTSSQLRATMPALDQALGKAPDTLTRVPTVTDDLSSFFGHTNVDLTDVNPMLGYLQPYGHDVAAFFSNFSQALNRGDANGKTLRIFMVYNEQTVKGIPVDTNRLPLLDKSNAYPAPGQSANPGPFTGTYPRVQPEPPR